LNKLNKADGDIVEEVARRQIFDWLPDGNSDEDYKILERVMMLSSLRVGILQIFTDRKRMVG